MFLVNSGVWFARPTTLNLEQWGTGAEKWKYNKERYWIYIKLMM